MTSNPNPLTPQEIDTLDGQMEREIRATEALQKDLNRQRSRLTRNRTILRDIRENIDMFDRDKLDRLLATPEVDRHDPSPQS